MSGIDMGWVAIGVFDLLGGDMAYVQVTNLDGTPTGVTDYDEIKQMFKVW